MRIKEFLKNNYEGSEIDFIANGNLINGVHGFIYYSETVAFYDKHQEEILALVEDLAEEYGLTYGEMIKDLSRGCHTVTQYKNALCWFAVEHVARTLSSEWWGDPCQA